MRAVAVRAAGDTPELMELAKPPAAAGEVLVRLMAAAVNPMDWQIAGGLFEGRMPHTFPLILGVDGVGQVEATGDGVRGLAAGDIVHGQFFGATVGRGTFAEFVSVAEDTEYGAIQRVPDGIPAEIAAALPTAGMTALGALRFAGLQAGQVILILGATGGVGSLATQLAAAAGACVIATARPSAAGWIRELGASETADYTAGDLVQRVRTAHPGGVDVLLDLVGGQDSFAAAASLVKDGGVAVSVAFGASPQLLASERIRVTNYMMRDKTGLLAQITAQAAAGRIKVPVQREVPLAQVPGVLAENRAGGARGKTVIRI